MSKIYVVGIGPGAREQMTIQAIEAINQCQVIIGYHTYMDLIKQMCEQKQVISSQMTKEIERCHMAVEKAKKGFDVAVISSGDSGVYGMAGLVLEVVAKQDTKIEVIVVPGVTSALCSAALLGAPLTHDFVVISLSDLLTSWEIIEKRLISAAEGDFVICLYNPKSKKRQTAIVLAEQILLRYKKETTPVGIVRNAARSGQQIEITTLKGFSNKEIDMCTTVIIGNSDSYVAMGKMITPRGYHL